MKKYVLVLLFMSLALFALAADSKFSYSTESSFGFTYLTGSAKLSYGGESVAVKTSSIALSLDDSFFFNKDSNVGLYLGLDILTKSVDPAGEVSVIFADGYNGSLGLSARFEVADKINMLTTASLYWYYNSVAGVSTSEYGADIAAKLQFVVVPNLALSFGIEGNLPIGIKLASKDLQESLSTFGSFFFGLSTGISILY